MTITQSTPTPAPRPAAGDPQTPGPESATVTAAEPPKCPTRTRAYRDGKMVAEGFPAEQIHEILGRDEECVVWLDLFDPDEADLQIVTHEFGLHPLAVEDAVHDHQRPKVDRYESHLFVNVYAVAVQDEPLRLTSSEISMFVTRRALVTVRKSEFDVDTLIRRWDAGDDADPAAGVGFLLYGVLDAITDGHYDAIVDARGSRGESSRTICSSRARTSISDAGDSRSAGRSRRYAASSTRCTTCSAG